MAENIIKQTDHIDPRDQMALAGLVDFNPPKQTSQRIPDKSVGLFSQAPVAKQPTAPTNPVVQERIVGRSSRCPLRTKPNSKLTPKPLSTVEADLSKVVEVWARYRSTNGRDAIYMYLEMVFAVVRRWQRFECSKKNARAILRLRNGARRMRIEPFSILIFCTADPKVADAKTRSKWSRVLQYARIAKPADQPLTDFIKSTGGLNECARRFARDR
jgi:head-tail adaptor